MPNARQVNGKSLLNDITLNDEDIPSQVVSGQTTVEGALTDIDSRVSSQSQQIANLPPVIVSVIVDANDAKMSAADQAKLTADMIMCWYSGDRTKLKTDLRITPAVESATVTGTASSSTTFTVAFIHSANANSVDSVIKSARYTNDISLPTATEIYYAYAVHNDSFYTANAQFKLPQTEINFNDVIGHIGFVPNGDTMGYMYNLGKDTFSRIIIDYNGNIKSKAQFTPTTDWYAFSVTGAYLGG